MNTTTATTTVVIKKVPDGHLAEYFAQHLSIPETSTGEIFRMESLPNEQLPVFKSRVRSALDARGIGYVSNF